VKTLDRIEKIVGYIGLVGCVVAGAAMLFNFGIIVVDVFRRFVLSSAIRGSTEYVSLGETVLIFFGMAYTQHKKGMVEITFFMRKLPGSGPVISWAVVNWLSAAVGVLLTYASYIHAGFVQAQGSATPTLYIPYFPFYYLMAVGLTLFAIELLFGAVKNTIALFHRGVRERVISQWPM
jgi:TRAP-type C4-dicarboxylate transport system permease small subunit